MEQQQHQKTLASNPLLRGGHSLWFNPFVIHFGELIVILNPSVDALNIFNTAQLIITIKIYNLLLHFVRVNRIYI